VCPGVVHGTRFAHVVGGYLACHENAMTKFQLRIAAGCLWLMALIAPASARSESTDAVLVARVVETIQHDSQFGMFDDVNISVEDRVVTLTGRVTRPNKKDDIGARVSQIDGVRRLVNDLEVLPLSPSDDDLRIRVARAIYNHPAFWQYASMAQPPIHILVSHGHVTLTGRVGTALDRGLANALAQVRGAFDVTNDLKVDQP
jgi:hyperosmotically inducible protein